MNQKITGIELIGIFKESCDRSHKLFIPDSPRQEAVANALAEHYDGELLQSAIIRYIINKPGPFLIFDFAIDSRAYIEIVKKERTSVNKFKDIVQETKKRLAEE